MERILYEGRDISPDLLHFLSLLLAKDPEKRASLGELKATRFINSSRKGVGLRKRDKSFKMMKPKAFSLISLLKPCEPEEESAIIETEIIIKIEDSHEIGHMSPSLSGHSTLDEEEKSMALEHPVYV